GDDGDGAQDQRVDDQVGDDAGGRQQVTQEHGADGGDRVGLEQVGAHAGTVADVVTDVVGDDGRVARVVLRDARFDLAYQVGPDVGRLGVDAAADAGEEADQRGAEREAYQRLDRVGQVEDDVEQQEEAGDAEQRQAGDCQARDGATVEGDP